MEMNILWYIALMLAGGLAFGRLAKLVRLPNVTGYLVAGLVLGPCLLKLIPGDVVGSLGVIPDAALGFIAFSVGGEFTLSYIRGPGRNLAGRQRHAPGRTARPLRPDDGRHCGGYRPGRNHYGHPPVQGQGPCD